MNKIKEDFLLVSDLHIDEYSKFAQVLEDGMNSRLFWSLDILDQIFEYGTQHGIKVLGIGGDVFHKRGIIPVAAYDATFEKLLTFLDAGWFVFSIVGNHDQATKSGEINSLRPMPINVVECAEVVTLPGGTQVGCVSFCETPSRFLEKLGKVALEKPDLYLIHQGVNNAKIAGDEILSRHEANAEDIRSITGEAPWIFSGHYHIHQPVDSRFYYIGSATPMDFSDTTPKGFLHVRAGTGSFTQIESRAPKFLTLTMADQAQDGKGHYVRMIYDGEEPKDMDKLGSLGWVATKSKVQREYEHRSSIEPDQTPMVIFRQYLSDTLSRGDVWKNQEKDLLEALNELLKGRSLEQNAGGHKIDIVEVQIRNFMRFKDQALDFQNLGGLTLIEGENLDDPSAMSNGAGKSTLLEAIKWCFFGTTARGLAGDEVVNSTVGKDCSVEMILALDDANLCRLRRYRKDSAHKNQFFFEVAAGDEWEDLRGKSDAETLENMIKFLGIDEQTFDTTVFFGHGFTKSFAGLTDKEQKAVLERIIGVEYFNELLEKARENFKKAEEECRALQIRASYLKNRLDEGHSSLNLLQADHQAFEKERSNKAFAIEEDIAEAKNFIASVQDSKEETARLRELKQQIKDLSKSKDPEQEGLGTLKERESYAQDEIKKAQAEIARLEKFKLTKEFTAKGLREKIAEMEARSFSSDPGLQRCPTCNQATDPKFFAELVEHNKKEIEGKTSALHDAERELQEMQSYFEKAEYNLKKYSRVQQKAKEKLDLYTESLEKLRDLEVEAEKISREKQQIESALSSRRTHLAALQSNLKAVLESENPLDSAIKRATQSVLDIESECVEIGTKEAAASARVGVFRFWETAFSDKGSAAQPPIKSYLFDSIVPVLDELARQYSEILTSGSIEVQFNTVTALKSGELRDKFSVSVVNKHGASDYRGDSGGERRKVDLAIMFALHSLARIRSGSLINILCLDEILDSLDSEGCERVMVLLREMCKEIPIIFVITHNENLKNQFGSRILIRKKDGASEIFDYASSEE